MTDPAPPAESLRPGTLFDGWLRVERLLGQGGMGVVYLARDTELDRLVALKVMRPADAEDGEDTARTAETRFLQEAQIAASLEHSRIVPVHRRGIDKETGLLYFTMRACLLSGEEVVHLCDKVFDCPYPCASDDWATAPRALLLADLLDGGKALPERAVARIGLDLVDAIAFAHAATPAVVHRDIKPSNVLFDASGAALLSDFGIAKRIRGDGNADGRAFDTTGTAFVGTAMYAAPEQAETGHAVPASDYHALGALLYRALTGVLPTSLKHPSSFDQKRISRRWDGLLARMLENDPAKRLADPKIVSAELHRILDGTGRRSRWAWIAGAAAVALAIGIGTALPPRRAGGPVESAAVLHVSAAAADDGHATGTALHPYASLQQAIDAAPDGATVRVAAGEYTGAFAIAGKAIRLLSEEGAEKTVLHGIHAATVLFVDDAASNTVVQGFTIRGGTGRPAPSTYGFDYFGGGIHCRADAVFRDCVIAGNGQGVRTKDEATFGGGVYARGGHVRLEHCRLEGNVAWACGGAAFVEYGTLEMKECVVRGNRADPPANRKAHGIFQPTGGIGMTGPSTLVLDTCAFQGNDGLDVRVFQCLETGAASPVLRVRKTVGIKIQTPFPGDVAE